MTPNKGSKRKGQGKPAAGPACPACGGATVSEARYCHACGASLQPGSGGGKWSPGRLTGLAAVAAVVVVAVVAVVTFSERDSAPPPSSIPLAPMFDAPPVARSGGLPDLSRMTPREAADRLFNRIMMASEQGKRAEALRFVPMAVEAYGGLPAMDRDAIYHLGLIHGVAGNHANVERQIAALRQGARNHLLALVLEHDAAERSGDRAAVSRVLGAYAAAYGAEIAIERPEYGGHRKTIERFRATALSRAAPSTAGPVGAARQGAALFGKNCAVCHGARAAGSDKGPPLVHKIYEPSHHDDRSFYRAVHQGTRSHHWSFGDMPPVPGVSDREVGRMIAYVRELQRAAGIR